MTKKFILILGGARSGKSSYAVALAKKLSRKVTFIATAIPSDREMKKRIRLHKSSRPRHWKTIEEGKEIEQILSSVKKRYEVVLIDCFGLFVSNLLFDNLTDKGIEKRIKEVINSISRARFRTIVVSNEVGEGVVPSNLLARRFRDLVGLANQMMAEASDEVILMKAGIPMKIKGDQI